MTLYLFLTTVLMLLGGVIWTHEDLPNFIVKIVLFVLGGWGLLLTLLAYGWVIQK